MLIIKLLNLYLYVVLASMVLTWLPVNGITRALAALVHSLTEPALGPIRKVLPQGGGVDWSPTVLYIGVSLLIYLIPS
jgi:YggT family protein